jgi:hypothetical protein
MLRMPYCTAPIILAGLFALGGGAGLTRFTAALASTLGSFVGSGSIGAHDDLSFV